MHPPWNCRTQCADGLGLVERDRQFAVLLFVPLNAATLPLPLGDMLPVQLEPVLQLPLPTAQAGALVNPLTMSSVPPEYCRVSFRGRPVTLPRLKLPESEEA